MLRLSSIYAGILFLGVLPTFAGAQATLDQDLEHVLPNDGPLFAASSYLAGVHGSDVDRNIGLGLRQHLRVRPRHNEDGFSDWLDGRSRFRFTMDWTFEIMLRRHTSFQGAASPSSPIRSPSVKWEWAPFPEFRWHWRDPVEEGGLVSSILHFTTGLTHYSNGQSGCLFEGYSRQPDESARPHREAPPRFLRSPAGEEASR